MTGFRLAASTAAASLAGAAVLGLGAPALAQEYPPATGAGATVTDSTPVPGQTVTISSGAGAFDAGSTVAVSIAALGISGEVTAAGNGSASFTFEVPEDAPAGRVTAVLSGTLDGAATAEEVSFDVVAAGGGSAGDGAAEGGAAGGGQADRASGLPFTGSDELVPMAITGLALVGVGAGLAVVARRRAATDLPADLA